MAGLQDTSASSPLASATVDEIAKQAVPQYASAAARDADATLAAGLREGLCVYLLDLNKWTVYTGSGWSTIGPIHGVTTAPTLALDQGGAVTFTQTFARYSRVGRWVTGQLKVTATGAGTGANAIKVSGMPVAAAVSACGFGILDDATGNQYPFQAYFANTSEIHLRVAEVGSTKGYLGSASFTAALASGDVIDMTLSYEAAADA